MREATHGALWLIADLQQLLPLKYKLNMRALWGPNSMDVIPLSTTNCKNLMNQQTQQWMEYFYMKSRRYWLVVIYVHTGNQIIVRSNAPSMWNVMVLWFPHSYLKVCSSCLTGKWLNVSCLSLQAYLGFLNLTSTIHFYSFNAFCFVVSCHHHK